MAAPVSDSKDRKSYTLDEAAAYDAGFQHGYVTAMQVLAPQMLKVSESVQFEEPPPENDKLACWSHNPNKMCKDCNCWKMTREYCS